MKELFKTLFNTIINLLSKPFVKEVTIIVITAIVTHIFEVKKSKRERLSTYKTQISDEILSALKTVRELTKEIMALIPYEGSINNAKVVSINSYRELIYYPSCMSNIDTFSEYCNRISKTREQCEQYLDLKSASYLYALEKYMMALALYIKKTNGKVALPEIGLIVIVDLHKWGKQFDIHLVKQINNPHYTLFSQHGKKWNKAKSHIENTFLNNTQLQELIKESQVNDNSTDY